MSEKIGPKPVEPVYKTEMGDVSSKQQDRESKLKKQKEEQNGTEDQDKNGDPKRPNPRLYRKG